MRRRVDELDFADRGNDNDTPTGRLEGGLRYCVNSFPFCCRRFTLYLSPAA